MTQPRILIRRAYAPPGPNEGRRVLVDRLWPRGLSKAELGDAIWMKDVAPSAALRKWFGHKPARWAGFRARYLEELAANPAVAPLRDLLARGPVTLVYGARDELHNQAVVLAEFLRAAAGPPPAAPRPFRNR